MLSPATRMMIELSLGTRSVDDTFALFNSAISEPVTREQIRGIHRTIAKRAAPPSPRRNDPPPPPSDARIGSALLLKRQLETGQFCGVPRAAWLARHGEAA